MRQPTNRSQELRQVRYGLRQRDLYGGGLSPGERLLPEDHFGFSLLVNFDTYDGTNPVTNWVFAFNAPAGATNTVYAGFYEYDDGTGTPLLSMPASGANASKYAISISNTQSSSWGGALGMWMGCIDASAYQGISFWVKGTTPTGKASFSFSNPETTVPDTTGYGGGTCSGTCKSPYIDFPVTTTWTQVLVPWGTFTPGIANGANVTTTGNDISGLTFNVSLNYVAAPGDAGYVACPRRLQSRNRRH
jgi:hypothetical protein